MTKLAIDGGKPVCEGLAWTRRLIGPEEKKAVVDLLDESITSGKAFDRYGGTHVDAYEKEFAAFVGTQYATAVSSGTAAVHTAVSALRLEPGREIVCSPITDPGAVAPVLMNLCIPVFADTEPGTFNVSADSIARVLSPRTAAIVVGHIAGEPAAIGPIAELARSKGLPLIEDCAQAHAARYQGKPVGSFGTAGAFSLMSGKHHTAGGQGGMITIDDREVYLNAKRFADRGKPFESDAGSNLFLGLNYRMTDLEAAIGRVQLQKLPGFAARRRRLAERVAAGLAGLKAVRLGTVIADTEPVYWFLRVHVDADRLSVSREPFVKAIIAEGVPAASTYTSIIYSQKWIRERNTFGTSQLPWTLPQYGRTIDYAGACPNAEAALASHMLVSFNESLTDEHADRIVEAFAKVEKAYLKK